MSLKLRETTVPFVNRVIRGRICARTYAHEFRTCQRNGSDLAIVLCARARARVPELMLLFLEHARGTVAHVRRILYYYHCILCVCVCVCITNEYIIIMNIVLGGTSHRRVRMNRRHRRICSFTTVGRVRACTLCSVRQRAGLVRPHSHVVESHPRNPTEKIVVDRSEDCRFGGSRRRKER